jgi:hypothetical protein
MMSVDKLFVSEWQSEYSYDTVPWNEGINVQEDETSEVRPLRLRHRDSSANIFCAPSLSFGASALSH